MNEYDAKVLKVVDGDTVDVDIDLGFGIVLTDERVRIMGIDTKGKFGRVLGDFRVGGKTVTEILIEEGHAVAYDGQSKDEIQDAHLANRNRLIAEGKVSLGE